jgi:hypothetical protein
MSDDRRAAPRLAVKAAATVKVDGALVSATLRDISPSGARFASDAPPALGTPVKVYLRSGMVIDGVVARATADGFAVAYADVAPAALPSVTYFWKLDSYVFASGEYTPRTRGAGGRHLPSEAMIERCTVTDWRDDGALIVAERRIPLGARVHLGGREMTVATKRGTTYSLVA